MLQAIKRIKEEYATEKQKGTKGIIQDGDIDITFMQVDLASLQSTKKFIENFKSSGQKLHTLVCNAGLGFLPLRKLLYTLKETHKIASISIAL